jgi:hypothetical protein
MLLFMSMAPMKEISLKKRSRVWKGKRKGQFLKMEVSTSETAPLIRL